MGTGRKGPSPRDSGPLESQGECSLLVQALSLSQEGDPPCLQSGRQWRPCWTSEASGSAGCRSAEHRASEPSSDQSPWGPTKTQTGQSALWRGKGKQSHGRGMGSIRKLTPRRLGSVVDLDPNWMWKTRFDLGHLGDCTAGSQQTRHVGWLLGCLGSVLSCKAPIGWLMLKRRGKNGCGG